MEQRVLSGDQISAFYHDEFVKDQVEHFDALTQKTPKTLNIPVIDVGGGMGHFALAVRERLARSVKVIDMDAPSIDHCKSVGLEAELGDALAIRPSLLTELVCFNLILHHLVAPNEQATQRLQTLALANWCKEGKFVFVNEYIYESYVGSLSARLIYEITSSRLLSALAKTISVLIPSLRANTFGVGVRFRSHTEWLDVFSQAGLGVIAKKVGHQEQVSAARRLLLIRSISRTSYLLAPALK
jgi:hypothetical protein